MLRIPAETLCAGSTGAGEGGVRPLESGVWGEEEGSFLGDPVAATSATTGKEAPHSAPNPLPAFGPRIVPLTPPLMAAV